MAGKWVPILLGDGCTKIGSGATPRGGSDVYLQSGPFALIRSQNVHNSGFRHEGLVFIGDEHAAELDNVEVHEGDVLLNITGDSVARACQVHPRVLPARVNQHVAIIRPDPNKLDSTFLRYSLISPESQAKLHSWAGSGGTRHALTKRMIESFQVLAPRAVEQRAIANVLGTLDGKIELNQRMNETLEGIARALFKSWFVDFDPVRAKAESSDPGLPKPLADLFPDRLVASDLGDIPEGWTVGNVEDVVVQRTEKVDPRRSPEARFAHYSIPAFDDGLQPRWERGVSIKSVKSRVSKGVILLSKLNPEIERVWLVDVEDQEAAVCSTEFVVLQPRPPFTCAYVYCMARSRTFRQQLEGLVTGTSKSHQRSPVKAIFRLPWVLPTPPIARAFDELVGPMLARTLAGRREARTLGAMRDTLLPKVVSGELRLGDAERLIGSAV